MKGSAFGWAGRGPGPRRGFSRPGHSGLRKQALVFASLALCWLLLASGAPVSSGEQAPQPDRYISLDWSLPSTVAQASHAVSGLYLVANPGGTHSLYWEGGGLWHLLLDSGGRALSTPRLIGRERPTFWSPHGTAQYFARDASGDIHMVWDVGGSSIHYRKVDPLGKVLVPDRLIRSNAYGVHGATLCIAGEDLLTGYMSYEPQYGEYRFVVQRMDLNGEAKGRQAYLSSGGWGQPLDGELQPASDGGANVVLACSEGGIYLHLGADGAVDLVAPVQFLPRGVIPAMAGSGTLPPVLAWNTWENGGSGRIVTARITASGAESIYITSPSTAVSDPSVVIEHGGEALLGWADSRVGGSEAYCARVTPDRWEAYPPNLRMNGADSRLRHVAVTVDPGNRVFAAWEHESYIRQARAYSYGFDVVGGSGIVRPHGSSTITLQLCNTGGFADTLSLALDPSSLPEGWNAVLPAGEVLLPSAEACVPITIRLTGPDSDAGERAGTLRLTAVSNGNPMLRQEVLIPVELEVAYRTAASLSPRKALAPPGTSVNFGLVLDNLGDSQDELALSAQAPSGLAVTFENSLVGLSWASSLLVNVTAITSDLGVVGDVYEFAVLVRSTRSGEVSSIPATVVVSPGVQVWLSSTESQKSLPPGSSTTFGIIVGNSGTSSGPADMSLEVLSGAEGWHASVKPSSLQLVPGEEADVALTVDAPADASGHFVVRVVATALGWGSSSSITVTAIAEPTHALQARAKLTGPNVLPGSRLLAPVVVSNEGSSTEEVSVDLSLPAGWSGQTYRQGALAGRLALGPGESVTLTAEVVPAADAPAGVYAAAALFSARSGASARADMDITVQQVFDLLLQTPTPSLMAAPGDTAVAVLSVRNLGNGPDRVVLATELPPGWQAVMTDYDLRPAGQLGVPAGGTIGVILELSVPYASPDAWSDVNVVATSQSGLRARISLRVGMLLPDLSVSVSYSPPRLAAGQSALATVTVLNTGEAPARNVVVAFNVDGAGTRLERILLIPAGSDKTATFSWSVSGGHHVLRYEVDPQHTILERDESNNVFMERVSIAGAPSAPAQIAPAVLAAGSATLILSAVGIAAGGTEYGKYWFLGLLFLPLYTKIKKDDVLDHFVRGQVYGYIKANPGEHYNSIKKALSLKNGTLVYHLKTLEREEFIKSVADGRFKRFYPKEMKVPEPSEELVLRMNHIQHEILKIIKECPGISQKEIAARIGLSTPTVHYHINIMMSARVISVKRAGRETQCFVEDVPEGKAG